MFLASVQYTDGLSKSKKECGTARTRGRDIGRHGKKKGRAEMEENLERSVESVEQKKIILTAVTKRGIDKGDSSIGAHN